MRRREFLGNRSALGHRRVSRPAARRGVFCGLVLLLAAWTAGGAGQEPVRLFDFGTVTSPVQPGWIGVNAGLAYEKAGYGWGRHGPLRDTDKKPANDLERDFCLGYGGKGDLAAQFLVDLPDGAYTAAFFAGDIQYSRQEMPMDILVGDQVLVEGWRVAKWDCRAAAFEVRGGRADFVFRSSHTPDKRYPFWLINAIAIYPGTAVDAVLTKALQMAGEIQESFVLKDFQEELPQPEPDAAPVTDEDRRRGYIPFARNLAKIVLPATLPSAQERDDGLRAQCTPGSYTHVTFGVAPLGDLGNCTVSVSDLKDGAKTIPAGAWTGYLARIGRQRVGLSRSKVYRWQPKVLDPTWQAQIPAGQSRWWWLTLRVPDDQPGGTYQGQVTFAPGHGSPHALAVTVRVWPFKLRQPPGEVFGMYWSRRYVLYPENIPKQFADLREHGCNGITLDLAPKGGFDPDGRLQLDFAEMDEIIKLAAEHGLTAPIPWNGASRIRSMTTAKLDTEEGQRQYQQIVAAVAAHARKAGWPPLLFYPCDEPPREEILRYLPLIKGVPEALTYCTPNNISVGLGTVPWMDYACWQHRSANDQTREATLKAGKHFWYYSSNYGENSLTARMRSGFLRWRLGATGMYYWHYQAPHGDPYNCLDSSATDHCVAYPTPQGPIPSIGWEGQREGIDDYKYVRMLEWAIQQAGPADPCVPAARETLAELRAAIPGDGLQVLTIPETFTVESFDHYRAVIAQHIAAILGKH